MFFGMFEPNTQPVTIFGKTFNPGDSFGATVSVVIIRKLRNGDFLVSVGRESPIAKEFKTKSGARNAASRARDKLAKAGVKNPIIDDGTR